MEIKAETGINTDYSLLQAKVEALSKSPSKTQKTYSEEEKAKLAESARGFESIFVNMMFKGMKSAFLDTIDKDKSEGGMSFGDDTLSGYTDMAFADEIANTGSGIGLAQMIYRQVTGEKTLPNKQTIALSYASGASITPPLIKDANSNSKNQINIPLKFNVNGNNSENIPSGNFIERVTKRLSYYEPIIQQAAEKYELPVPLIKAVITTESAGNPTAKSPVGAKGLMQLMDATAKGLGVTNSYDPQQNIMGGAKYLRQMLNTFDGDLEKSIAAYNAGPGNVKKYDGIPPFAETQAYVKKVKSHIKTFSS
jgi:Rod binding domain-containing protein